MKTAEDRTFLTESEVDEMTDIRSGKGGKTKYDLQRDHLRKHAVAFTESARGRPVIAIATVEGRRVEPIKKAWQPKIAHA